MPVRRQQEAPTDHRRVRWLGRLCSLSGYSLVFGVLGVLATKLSGLGILPGLSLISYIPAWFLLLPILMGATLVYGGSSVLRGAVVLLAPLPILAIAFYREEPFLFAPEPVAKEQGGMTLMVFNVQAYSRGEQQVIDVIRDHDPDILALVEGTFRNRSPDRLRRALGPEYQWVTADRLSVASRIPIAESRLIADRRDYAIQRVLFESEGEPAFVIYLLDMNPPWRRTRSSFRDAVAHLMYEPLPHLIVGDFNAPRGSYAMQHFARWLPYCALQQSGYRGLAATWPSEFPMLQLDYIFGSEKIRFFEAMIPATTVSDHRPVIARFRVNTSVADEL